MGEICDGCNERRHRESLHIVSPDGADGIFVAAFSLDVKLPTERILFDFSAPDAVAAWQATCDAKYGGTFPAPGVFPPLAQCLSRTGQSTSSFQHVPAAEGAASLESPHVGPFAC